MASQQRIFHVFYGEETYLLDRELRRALKWPDRHVISLDGQDVSEDRIVSSLEDLPVADDKGIVVVVDNADKVKLSRGLVDFAEGRDAHDQSALLVAVYRGQRLAKGWCDLGKWGRAVEHARFKPWERDKVQKRLEREAELLSLSLLDAAFDVLFKAYGEDTSSMVNELRKVSYLTGKGGQVTKDLVLSLCPRRFAVAPWDVSEAALAKDPARALRAASMLFQDQGDEVLVPIVASLMKQVEQALLMRSLLDRQQSPEAIAASVGMHPYRVQKELVAVKKHTTSQLVSHMKSLCDLEAQVKGAAPSKRSLVELAVLALAA